MQRREPSHTVGGNVNWYSHYGEQYGGSLKKLKIELPCITAIPFLGMYLEKNMTGKDPCTCVHFSTTYNSQDTEAN